MPPIPGFPADPTATAVAREADWLTTTGDNLPPLRKADGGLWDVVQAYWPGNRMGSMRAGIYVTRHTLGDQHPVAQRYRPQYLFRLKLTWPIKQATTPLAENEQANFDLAVGYLVQRIRGPLGDKTHGGRFLSVAQVPENEPVVVDFDDPEVSIQAVGALTGTATYYGDDNEFNG
jgi:hypothetical protein